MKKKIAIIGTGLAGVTAAKYLENEYKITLFEKARGIGGRMSARRSDPYQFDHGAQYFTARTEAFKSFLKPTIDDGLIKDWQAKVVTIEKGKKPYKREWFEPHYVVTPRMNSLCKHLAEGHEVELNKEIYKTSYTEGLWYITDTQEQSYGPYNWLILAIPSNQASRLLPANFNEIDEVTTTKMLGSFTLMLGFKTMPKLNWDIAFPKNSIIKIISKNSTKPDRQTAPSIVIQSTNQWAENHIEHEMEELSEQLLTEFVELSGIDKQQITHQKIHRWRYATVHDKSEKLYIIDNKIKLGVCGDWLINGNVESAFLSAKELSDHILNKKLENV